MTQRGQRLRRLLAIRRAGEEVERRHLQSALATAAAADSAVRLQREAITSSASALVAALSDGDAERWLLAGAESEVASSNLSRLLPILRSKQREVETISISYRDRRCEREQIQQLISNTDAEQQLHNDRKAQAAADDWFLARRFRDQR